MRYFILIVLIFLLINCTNNEQTTLVYAPAELTTEYAKNPSVVDEIHPRLSWVNKASKVNNIESQSAWQIRVASKIGGKYVYGMKKTKYQNGATLRNGAWAY